MSRTSIFNKKSKFLGFLFNSFAVLFKLQIYKYLFFERYKNEVSITEAWRK